MSEPKAPEGAQNEKGPPAPVVAPPPKPTKMVKVKVLRPFRLFSGTEKEVIHDNIGKIVSVPEADLPWLTLSVKGQAKGFGERLSEESSVHDMAKAVVVGKASGSDEEAA